MIRDTASLLAGNALYMASQWLVLVIITKYVDLSAAGVFSLSLAIVSPIFTLTNLGLRSVAATDIEEENDVRDYFLMAAIGNVVGLTASVTIAGFVFNDNPVGLYVLFALLLSKIVESHFFLLYGFFQRHLTISYISRSLAIRSALGFSIFLLLLLITGRYEIALFGIPAAWLVVLLLYDTKNASRLDLTDLAPRIHSERISSIKRLFRMAFPLGILACFTVTSQQIPRYFIASTLLIEDLGVYAGIIHLAWIGAVLVNAVGQSAIGKLAKLYKTNFRGFVILQSKIVFVAITAGIAGILIAYSIGDLLLMFIYNSDFAQHKDIFVYAMVWCGIMYISTAIGTGLSGMRLFKPQSYIGGINLLVICASSFIFIPKLGLAGALYALILTATFKLFFQCVVFFISIREKLTNSTSCS